ERRNATPLHRVKQGVQNTIRIRPAESDLSERDRAESLAATRRHAGRSVVECNLVFGDDLIAERFANFIDGYRSSEEDSTFRTLIVQLRGHDVWRFRQRLRSRELRATTVPKDETRARTRATLRDAIRIREREKFAGDIRGRCGTRVHAKLPSQAIRFR